MKLFRISILKFGMVTIVICLIAVFGVPKFSDARDLTVVSWGGAYQEAQPDEKHTAFINAGSFQPGCQSDHCLL